MFFFFCVLFESNANVITVDEARRADSGIINNSARSERPRCRARRLLIVARDRIIIIKPRRRPSTPRGRTILILVLRGGSREFFCPFSPRRGTFACSHVRPVVKLRNPATRYESCNIYCAYTYVRIGTSTYTRYIIVRISIIYNGNVRVLSLTSICRTSCIYYIISLLLFIVTTGDLRIKSEKCHAFFDDFDTTITRDLPIPLSLSVSLARLRPVPSRFVVRGE